MLFHTHLYAYHHETFRTGIEFSVQMYTQMRFAYMVATPQLGYVTSAKDYLTFPENLKQLSSLLTNIWILEASYIIKQEGR